MTITEEDFLIKACQQPNQWEYHQGQLVACEPASEAHRQIVQNLIDLFSKNASTISSLVFIPLVDAYVYPDFVLLPSAPILYEAPQQASAVLNPALVVEIMSPQTKQTDTQLKWEFYQQVPHLEQYLLIDEQRPLLQLFTRNEQGWKLEIIKHSDNTKPFLLHNKEVLLKDIYQQVV
ncbi:Uma2 family endonuclease [uncultured Microscilla sp.]|uniref:Uma2 family endonuclease n=1 Tax=uncultured Microscilla sp. TaxID=432653 RepID=UPI002619E227|nr:Uma2 family endonuclease [uncultured Microscilla sp.]